MQASEGRARAGLAWDECWTTVAGSEGFSERQAPVKNGPCHSAAEYENSLQNIFFRLLTKELGPSFTLVSRLHCAGSCVSLVLFTWVIPFEFGLSTCVCKVTHMLSVFFIYWNYVGLYFFHLLVQPSSCWHQGYCEAAQSLPFACLTPFIFHWQAEI